jgi:hypothetical protein
LNATLARSLYVAEQFGAIARCHSQFGRREIPIRPQSASPVPDRGGGDPHGIRAGQESHAEARNQWREAVDKLRGRFPKRGEFMDQAEKDVLAFMHFPTLFNGDPERGHAGGFGSRAAG